MVYCVLMATIVGTYSPLNKEVITGLVVMFFPICGFANGYSAGRLYAFMHGTNWPLLGFTCGLAYPLIIAAGIVVIDICEFVETKKLVTIHLSDGLILGILCIAVNVPLNMTGCFFGYKTQPISVPTKPSRIPKESTKSLPWWLNFHLQAILSGFVPVLLIAFE
jgi:hypothetical protein